MIAFALKTVFALFTFFAVANSHECRYTGNAFGSTLQLFTQPECGTEHLGDSQTIFVVRTKMSDPCACRPVIPSVGENLLSYVFEPGVKYPADFTFYRENDCLGKALPPPPPPNTPGVKMMVDLPYGHSKIVSVEFCGMHHRGKELKEPKPAVQTAEEKAEKARKAKDAKTVHGTGIKGVWREVKSSAEHSLAGAKKGVDKIVDGHPLQITGTEAKEMGVSVALGLGVVALAPVAL